jgi:endonuclease YncB( thermonuclease family)
MAAILWLAAVLYPGIPRDGDPLPSRGSEPSALSGSEGDAIGGNGAVVSRQNGASALSGNGVFVLCAQAREANCVIDGDTIRFGGVKIRLEDIDAPETQEPRCASEAARGRRATARLLELINAGPFELVRAGEREVDRYGRRLRTIERDGRSLGDMLIAEGLARRWDGARRSWCG